MKDFNEILEFCKIFVLNLEQEVVPFGKAKGGRSETNEYSSSFWIRDNDNSFEVLKLYFELHATQLAEELNKLKGPLEFSIMQKKSQLDGLSELIRIGPISILFTKQWKTGTGIIYPGIQYSFYIKIRAGS